MKESWSSSFDAQPSTSPHTRLMPLLRKIVLMISSLKIGWLYASGGPSSACGTSAMSGPMLSSTHLVLVINKLCLPLLPNNPCQICDHRLAVHQQQLLSLHDCTWWERSMVLSTPHKKCICVRRQLRVVRQQDFTSNSLAG